MLNSYHVDNKKTTVNNETNVDAVNAEIKKTHPRSFFKECESKSPMAKKLLHHSPTYLWDTKTHDREEHERRQFGLYWTEEIWKPVVVLQIVTAKNNNLLFEIVLEEHYNQTK